MSELPSNGPGEVVFKLAADSDRHGEANGNAPFVGLTTKSRQLDPADYPNEVNGDFDDGAGHKKTRHQHLLGKWGVGGVAIGHVASSLDEPTLVSASDERLPGLNLNALSLPTLSAVQDDPRLHTQHDDGDQHIGLGPSDWQRASRFLPGSFGS